MVETEKIKRENQRQLCNTTNLLLLDQSPTLLECDLYSLMMITLLVRMVTKTKEGCGALL